MVRSAAELQGGRREGEDEDSGDDPWAKKRRVAEDAKPQSAFAQLESTRATATPARAAHHRENKKESPHSPAKTELDDLKTQTQVPHDNNEGEGNNGAAADENSPPRSQTTRTGVVAYRFMLSSLPEDLKKYYMHVIQELGGVVHDEISYMDTVTHVVAKDLRKSERIFHAIAARKKIFRISFLDQSFKLGHFVEDEEPHLWSSNPPASLASPGQDADGIANCIRRWQYRGAPFAKQKVFLMLSIDREKKFALMLRNGGASVKGSKTKLKNQEFTLAFFEGTPLTTAQEQAVAWMRQRGIPCLGPEFIVSYLRGEEDLDLRCAKNSKHAIK